FIVKNKGLITEAYEWDEEEVSSDDNDMVEVKVLMALVEENDVVSKEGARNVEWVKISMRKIHTLLDMKDNDDRKHVNTKILKENKNLRISPDDEEDTRSIHEYLDDLEEEYQARDILAKSKRFFKKDTQWFSSAKATGQTECHKCVAGDGVASIKQCHRDQSSDAVKIMAMASGHGRLKEDLESSTWRRRQEHKATSSC
nr:hypothetical protein [Tanacetum cinerariifolium]